MDNQRQSIVVITGFKSTGDEVIQELLITHGPGAQTSDLIGKAFNLLASAGGIMNDGPDESVNFYPLQALSQVVFSVKKVQLATNLVMPH